MKDLLLAIDIGGTQFRLALISDREMVARVRRATEREGGASWMIRQIIDEGRRLLTEASAPVKACGIGFGGPVDFHNQRIVRSHHVSGWEDVALPDVLREAFGIPCIVDNDANAAALGEFHYGAGQGATHMVYYTVSTGIGGGIVLDGRLYRGKRGRAGEVGHTPIFADSDVICSCGNKGCLEAYCSGLSIARRAREALKEANRLSAAENVTTARDVFSAAGSDPLMKRIVDDTAKYLGASIGGLHNLLDLDVVVIGGGVSQAGEWFIEAVERSARSFMLDPDEHGPQIVASSLGDDSVLWGAARLTQELRRE
ncbi:MAG: ROK family protein [Firmicutes bacterium]|nr:ROK family protein [Bacillota bacterium]